MNHEKLRKHSRILWALSVTALMAAGLALLFLPARHTDPGELPPLRAAGSDVQVTLSDSCELIQTFAYQRCGHTVTRRTTAPEELHGKPLAQVEALYPDWQVTEFASALVKMEKKPELFCPDHLVLMPDGAGVLCVFENRYGDAYLLSHELSIELKSLPAAMQEEAAHGIGFADAAALEAWLESVES